MIAMISAAMTVAPAVIPATPSALAMTSTGRDARSRFGRLSAPESQVDLGSHGLDTRCSYPVELARFLKAHDREVEGLLGRLFAARLDVVEACLVEGFELLGR